MKRFFGFFHRQNLAAAPIPKDKKQEIPPTPRPTLQKEKSFAVTIKMTELKAFAEKEIALVASLNEVFSNENGGLINKALSERIVNHPVILNKHKKRNIHIFKRGINELRSNSLIKLGNIYRKLKNFFLPSFLIRRDNIELAIERARIKSQEHDEVDASKILYAKTLLKNNIIPVFLDHNLENIMYAIKNNIPSFFTTYKEGQYNIYPYSKFLKLSDDHLLFCLNYLNLLKKFKNLINESNDVVYVINKIKDILLEENVPLEAQKINYQMMCNVFLAFGSEISTELYKDPRIFEKFLKMKSVDKDSNFYHFLETKSRGFPVVLYQALCPLIHKLVLPKEYEFETRTTSIGYFEDTMCFYSEIGVWLANLPKEQFDDILKLMPANQFETFKQAMIIRWSSYLEKGFDWYQNCSARRQTPLELPQFLRHTDEFKDFRGSLASNLAPENKEARKIHWMSRWTVWRKLNKGQEHNVVELALEAHDLRTIKLDFLLGAALVSVISFGAAVVLFALVGQAAALIATIVSATLLGLAGAGGLAVKIYEHTSWTKLEHFLQTKTSFLDIHHAPTSPEPTRINFAAEELARRAKKPEELSV